jgi:hypothetical protein
MITAVVTFKLPPGLTREQWQEQIKQVSTRFQNVPGLIRRQFLYNASVEVSTCGKPVRRRKPAPIKAPGAKAFAGRLAVTNLISPGLRRAS